MHAPPTGTSHQHTVKKGDPWLLIPVYGALIFVLLYFVSAFLYPGGSQVDPASKGFSWINNYWCNLLSKEAIDGQSNPARPVAVAGTLVLSLSFISFWYIFPRLLSLTKGLRFIIQASGLLAMLVALLLFTGINHDLVTNVASGFGMIATVGTIFGLYNKRWYGLFCHGLLNMLLVAVNNYLYYSSDLIHYLPLIQKISFASFLLWICVIDLKLFHLAKRG